LLAVAAYAFCPIVCPKTKAYAVGHYKKAI
jgi:hypothetical protein